MADNKDQQFPTSTLEGGSLVRHSGFNNFMSSLFGWQRASKNSRTSRAGTEFTKVDLDSANRIPQAIASVKPLTGPTNGKLSATLDSLFNNWLSDNTDKIQEITNRKNRIDQISYAILNEPIIAQICDMYADESTQADISDSIIGIETPDLAMAKEMYRLLAQWGITQSRIRNTIYQMSCFGDAFWAISAGLRGISRVVPLQQQQVIDRLEFNPSKESARESQKKGLYQSFANNNYLIQQMLDSMEETTNVADIFDSKLFGFELASGEDTLVVPPWCVLHFRINGDTSPFFPFGESPIINTIAPFKVMASTMTLQALARVMSFPVTLYKVKTSDTADNGYQFDTVNTVREQYDDIGVTSAAGSTEVYTVNTKIWIPDGLLDVDVKKSEVDTKNVDDLELYRSRLKDASTLPKTFFDDGSWGPSSAKSLVEQYKPFARKVFSIQSAFLDSLADLFRIHFAITGQFDFRVPFTLSLKFPAEEQSEDKFNARKNSIDMAKDIIEFIRSMVGLSDDEMLPPDITRDIMSKYTFLDPEDIIRWTRQMTFSSAKKSAGGAGPLGGSSGDESQGPAASALSDLMGSGITEESLESDYHMPRLREKQIREAYYSHQDKLEEEYIRSLSENNVEDFVRNKNHIHLTRPSSENMPMLEALASAHRTDSSRLQEKGFNGYRFSNKEQDDGSTLEEVKDPPVEDDDLED